MSQELVTLCLSQLPSSILHDKPYQHPHFSHARQKPTNIYSNVIRVEVVMVYRHCCMEFGVEGEFLADIREDFCFIVKYFLCPRCSEHPKQTPKGAVHPTSSDSQAQVVDVPRGHSRGRSSPPFKSARPKTPQGSVRSIKSTGINGVFSSISRRWRKLLPSSSSGGASHASTAGVEGTSTVRKLPVDCSVYIQSFLPVGALNALSRVSQFWYQCTAPQLQQFNRFVDAWNLSIKQGVYINLDDLYSPQFFRSLGEIYVGGYLHVVKAEVIENVEYASPTTVSVNLRPTLQPLNSVCWNYCEPKKDEIKPNQTKDHLMPAVNTNASSSGVLPSQPNLGREWNYSEPNLLAHTLLQCLLPQHRYLLEHMCETYEVVLRGTPIFSRGSVLFPYIVSTSPIASHHSQDNSSNGNAKDNNVPAYPKTKDGDKAKLVGFYICFMVSS
jgi:hypothetical protein